MLRLPRAFSWSLCAAALLLLPGLTYAQTGAITGVARDASGAALPGVTVEVSSPALIEKVRTAVTGDNGRYQITALPVGTYEVKFSLPNFSTVVRGNIVLTSEFTATVNADLKVGEIKDTVNVVAEAPVVDVQNARQQITFQGEEIRDLPTDRNITSMLNLVPGFATSRGTGFSTESCSGGIGIFCSPNLPNFNAHASRLDIGDQAGLGQGRIMVDGIVINSGSPNIQGMTSGIIPDVGGSQEVTFSLSGALGESETGGATINIIPRTGGNRFAGNFFSAYTGTKFFDKNNGTRNNFDDNIVNPNGTVSNTGNDINVLNPIEFDYDVSGSFGGPIKKDRMWFFGTARRQGKEQVPSPGNPFYWNLNYGIAGKNYEPDRSRGSLTYENLYRNASMRLTIQATEKNKFGIFWDEQDSCQDPCYGVVSVFTSPESWWSVSTRPAHNAQLTWTNPMTNRLLLEGRLGVTQQHYDTRKHREIASPSAIPRISEIGTTAGIDALSAPNGVNPIAQGFGLSSGPLNSAAGEGGAELRNLDQFRPSGSVSYITGSHNLKAGVEAAYFSEKSTNQPNDLRLTYNYATPAATCGTPNNQGQTTCGNTSLYYPEDPDNTIFRRPVPTSFTVNTGIATLDEKVWWGAFYVQDQWTLNRFTINAALRYDHAQSRYGQTCVGGDGNEPWMPVQIGGAYDGQRFYCTEPSNGVNYNDITPRWGVAWDVFGTGKTSIKWNMGKYLRQATIGGLYNDDNPARRAQQSMTRTWQDNNGNRVPDCDMSNLAEHNTFGDVCGSLLGSTTAARFGRDPLGLDASGLNNQFFATTQCGRHNRGNELVQAYCEASGDNLLGGWGARRYEWQFGLGVQHELLPRFSVEVTYNRRMDKNQTVTDVLGRGCDRFDVVPGALPERECQQNYLDYIPDDLYNFYSVTAPVDSRLPNGGGYVIVDANQNRPNNQLPTLGTAVAFAPGLDYAWAGVDTNFVLRARGGLRVSGGTSTGRSLRDTCFSDLTPNVKGREGNNNAGGCRPYRPMQTNIRANASYTVPWVDVLVSAIYSYQPGVERSANLQIDKAQLTWLPGSEARATQPCTVQGVATQGCIYGGAAANTTTVNLLDFGDLYGEPWRLVDLKFAKNFRFAGKRLNFGVDVYNLFNSDAITGYNNTYTAWFDTATGQWVQGLGVEGGRDNPATAAVERQNWGRPTGLVQPRFMRFQLNFDF